MEAYECPHMYRKKGEIGIYCWELERQGYLPYCEQEYFCQRVGRYELKPEAKKCDIMRASKRRS